jgi:hypothetical protein
MCTLDAKEVSLWIALEKRHIPDVDFPIEIAEVLGTLL